MRYASLLLAATAAVATLAAAGAASAQSNIRVGQTVNGSLAVSDPKLSSDNSSYDCYVFQAQAGSWYQVDYKSSAFDAFVAVGQGRNCAVDAAEANDDGPDGLDSQLVFQAETGGTWFIRANSLEAGETGAYTLTLGNGTAPAVLASPDEEESIFQYLAICMAADIAMEIGGQSPPEDESLQIFELLMLAGEEENMSEDDITNAVAEYVAAWTSDEELLRSSPPATVRAECIATINAA
ncbi:hypothetical protein [Brevundimonas sp.]|uniref:hypothetical protein n=1 Tax=Brevundimonas sp. TaxID=1871086 RepID=UPI002AB8BC07|nr:hypothetical protein [Brevundimonas sp.]MDZ4364832.1 hypothetical protein [Brevundimonas sp.]